MNCSGHQLYSTFCHASPDKSHHSRSAAWELETDNISGDRYSFRERRNASDKVDLMFNYSQCESPGEAGQSAYRVEAHSGRKPADIGSLHPITPTVRSEFDNIAVEIAGALFGRTWPPPGMDNQSWIGGPFRLTFSGSLDANRSDDLLGNSNGTPVWSKRLACAKSIFGDFTNLSNGSNSSSEGSSVCSTAQPMWGYTLLLVRVAMRRQARDQAEL